METNFIAWLNTIMRGRNLSQSDLSRLSKISQSQISLVISGGRKPGNEFLLGIADALRIPPESVFRAAGILPPAPAHTEQTEKLLFLFAQLPEKEKADLLDYIYIKLTLLDQKSKSA